MVTVKRPEWVEPGQQWSSGETYEEYKSSGKAISSSYTPKEPISAGDLVEGAETIGVNIPHPSAQDSTPDAFSAIGGAEGTSALFTQMTEQLEKMGEEREAMVEKQQSLWDKLTAKPVKSQAELLKEQYGEWAIPETMEQIKGITQASLPLHQQMADITLREQREFDRNEARVGTDQAFKDREANAITNKYAKMKAPIAVQLNAYAAQINALQGNVTIAQGFINAAVSAATYDQEFEYNRLKDFIDINESFLNSLRDDQKFLFTSALSIRKEELENARKDKTDISNLMLKYAQAGINLDDTLDEAVRKASDWSELHPETAGQIIGSAETGYFNVIRDAQGNIIRTEQVSGVGLGDRTGKQEEIDIYARQLRAGLILPSNVPQNIRGEVLIRQSELVKEDLRDDIAKANTLNNYGTRENLIEALNEVYPEIAKTEISGEVYSAIPDVIPLTPEETKEISVEKGKEAAEGVKTLTDVAKQILLGQTEEEKQAAIKKGETGIFGAVRGFFSGLFKD